MGDLYLIAAAICYGASFKWKFEWQGYALACLGSVFTILFFRSIT